MDTEFFDKSFEHLFPTWKEVTPEEYIARHWLSFGVCSIAHNKFQDPTMHAWAERFEQIFHDVDLIESCRSEFLSTEERQAQDRMKRKIDQNGL